MNNSAKNLHKKFLEYVNYRKSLTDEELVVSLIYSEADIEYFKIYAKELHGTRGLLAVLIVGTVFLLKLFIGTIDGSNSITTYSPMWFFCILALCITIGYSIIGIYCCIGDIELMRKSKLTKPLLAKIIYGSKKLS